MWVWSKRYSVWMEGVRSGVCLRRKNMVILLEKRGERYVGWDKGCHTKLWLEFWKAQGDSGEDIFR